MRFLSIPRASLAVFTLCALTGAGHADPHMSSGPLADTHAPAGVMFDHMHKAGEFMFGYRYAGTFASGSTQHGSHTVTDNVIAERGCVPHTCSMKAS
ncbi:MAG: hypothetical protein WD852_03485 [Methyloceanibacter sp.]